MKKYRKNEIKEHNRFYAGGDMNRKRNAQGKVGTSSQNNINDRFSAIRQEEPDFKPLGYIDIPYIHKTKLDALEADVKASLVDEGFVNTGNDHFEFTMAKGLSVKDNYAIFCARALQLAMLYCDNHNLKYTFKWFA